MNPDEHAQLYRELADALSGCYSPLEPSREVYLLATRAREAAEEIEGQEVPSGAAMTCSLLAQYQSEVDVIESVAGFTDESTPVGEAWARICGVLDRVGGGAQPLQEVPTLELVLKPIGDCWLQIEAPSGRRAAINLGPRGSFTDQTFIGSVILEVAELSQHRRQPLRVGSEEGLA